MYECGLREMCSAVEWSLVTQAWWLWTSVRAWNSMLVHSIRRSTICVPCNLRMNSDSVYSHIWCRRLENLTFQIFFDTQYSYTATMERGSFLKCETIDIPSTLTKSQSQVLQFLNGGSIFDYPSYESSPPVSLYPPKLISPCAQIQPPVMHPNLVCTLKSILSPRTEFDCSQSSTSGDSRCTESGISQISNVAEVQGSEQRADYSGTKASSPESTSWPRSSDFKQVNVPPILWTRLTCASIFGLVACISFCSCLLQKC